MQGLARGEGRETIQRESNSLQEDRRAGGVGVRACVHTAKDLTEGWKGWRADGGRGKEGSRRGPHG